MLKNPLLKLDYYKVGHLHQYPKGTEKVYSTWTPRGNTYMPYAERGVFFGLQGFIKKYLIEDMKEFFFDRPREDVIAEYEWFMNNTLFTPNFNAEHLGRLHTLGYMPIEIKALPEGTLVPMRVPMFTIENTGGKDFFWLTNYVETLMSATIWKTCVSATIANKYRQEFDKYAELTGYDPAGVQFQGHDFSYRGMAGDEAGQLSGAGHLLSFTGTDTIPAILYLMNYYNADIENGIVGTSIPATEHSVMCAGGIENEYETIKRLITETYPAGFVSIVSDTWDFWGAIENIYKPLKDVIMAREGKVVIRPDSGDPVRIICGYPIFDMSEFAYDEDYNFEDTYDAWYNNSGLGDTEEDHVVTYKGQYLLTKTIKGLMETSKFISEAEAKGAWETLYGIFGGVVNEKGFKELDEHIGLIYGDSITVERQEQILELLHNKGFATTVVLGIGSYTYNYNTRDSLGFAIKATNVVINGVETPIFKDPKTDDGLKKSAKGRVIVVRKTNGDLKLMDEVVYDDLRVPVDAMDYVFRDGEMLIDLSLEEIRDTLRKENKKFANLPAGPPRG